MLGVKSVDLCLFAFQNGPIVQTVQRSLWSLQDIIHTLRKLGSNSQDSKREQSLPTARKHSPQTANTVFFFWDALLVLSSILHFENDRIKEL